MKTKKEYQDDEYGCLQFKHDLMQHIIYGDCVLPDYPPALAGLELTFDPGLYYDIDKMRSYRIKSSKRIYEDKGSPK